MSTVEVPGRKIWSIPACFNAETSRSGMIRSCFAQESGDFGQQPVVRSRKDREPDRVDIFLYRRRGNLLGGLAQAGVDHLETGVAEGACNHFGSAVMPVQTGFGDQDFYSVHDGIIFIQKKLKVNILT